MLRKMHRRIANERAFTLIEVIVSLVLIGILAAIAGMGLVKIAEGYVFAKQNAETAQKAQIAIARIVKELGSAEKASGAASAITSAGTGSVTYTRRESAGSTTFITNTIDLSSGTIRVQVGNAAAATLINYVTAFSLVYRNALGNTTATLADIRRIEISLAVSGANNTPISFADSNKPITIFIQEFQ
jgi:prepilin-type N-terminal cleavage/methylation domain-containing protein